jgi:hypothetical protein
VKFCDGEESDLEAMADFHRNMYERALGGMADFINNFAFSSLFVKSQC